MLVKAVNVLVVHAGAAGQVACRADRLRQGQSGQAQLLELRRRRELAPVRRAVQDDGRHRHRACAVSRVGSVDRRTCSPATSRCRSTRSSTCCRTSSPAACARSASRRSRRNPTLPELPPIAETLAGLRRLVDQLHQRAGRHAAAGHRAAEPGDQRGAVRSGGRQAHGDRGPHADRREPARLVAAHQAKSRTKWKKVIEQIK